jgi:putative tryptophan/tyrosine transport system substrate-binding protein
MTQCRMSNVECRIGSTAIFAVVLAAALLAAPLIAAAQQPAKVYRIGFLSAITPPDPANTSPQGCPIQGRPNGEWQAFGEGLREHGYVPGQNLLIECRYAQGQVERAPTLAAELVSLTPDLIVAGGWSHNILALKQATRTIPILMVGATDPVERGFVASLAYPGGNITGLTDTVGLEVIGKQLQLLKEAVPKASRVAYLYYLGAGQQNPAWGTEVKATERALGLTVQTYRVQIPEELEGAFTAMIKAQVEALVVNSSAVLYVHRQRIVELTAKSRLPAMYPDRGFVEAGGLMNYWPNYPAIWRRAATYVDRILKGAKPADLPVEQPTKFELVINLKTAKALGLTIPPSLLMRADEVIE